MSQINRLTKLSQTAGTSSSFHEHYRHSAIIHLSGLPYQMTEGDLLILCAQYGEVEHVHLPKDEKTGQSKGHAFVGYEIQRATDLAVDNFNAIKIGNRTLKVDHVEKYRFPRQKEEDGSRTILIPERRGELDLGRAKEESEEEMDPYLRAAADTLKKKAKRKAKDEPADAKDEEDPMAKYLEKKRRKAERRLKKERNEK